MGDRREGIEVCDAVKQILTVFSPCGGKLANETHASNSTTSDDVAW